MPRLTTLKEAAPAGSADGRALPIRFAHSVPVRIVETSFDVPIRRLPVHVTPEARGRSSHLMPVLLAAAAVPLTSLGLGCAGPAKSPSAARTTESSVVEPSAVEFAAPEAQEETSSDVAAAAERVKQFADQLAAAPAKPVVEANEPAVPSQVEWGAPVPIEADEADPEPVPVKVVDAPAEPEPAPKVEPVAVVEAKPAEPAEKDDWETARPAASVAESLGDQLIRRLTERREEHPDDPAAHFDYALLSLIRGETPDLDEAVGLEAEERRIVTALAEGLATFRQSLEADGNPLPSERIRPIVEMSRRLRREVGLTLPAIQLCSKVNLFGSYEPVAGTFPAGQPRQIILYVEVDNFDTRQNVEGLWETKMSLAAKLYDAEGDVAWQLPASIAVDRSRQRRRDFFLATFLHFPADIAAGEYTLKVTVTDDLSKTLAEGSLPVSFVAGE